MLITLWTTSKSGINSAFGDAKKVEYRRFPRVENLLAENLEMKSANWIIAISGIGFRTGLSSAVQTQLNLPDSYK